MAHDTDDRSNQAGSSDAHGPTLTAAGATDAPSTGGCSAVERGDASPVLAPEFTRPFRWEIVPDPNPDCAVTSALGEADTREEAERDLRRAVAGFAAGFGFLYEVTPGEGGAPRVRELARLALAPRDVKPPAW